MAKKSKNKGNRYERLIAKKLSAWWGTEFQRTPQSGGSQLKESFRLAGDVVTTDPTFPFHIEAKNQEGWRLHQLFLSPRCKPWQWWHQACTECLDGQQPVVIMTRNHHPDWVLLHKRVLATWAPRNCIYLHDPHEHEVILFLFTDWLTSDPKQWISSKKGDTP